MARISSSGRDCKRVRGDGHAHLATCRIGGLSIEASQYTFPDANFCFRRPRGNLVKLICWDSQGFCLFAMRLEKGRFTGPVMKQSAVMLAPAQLSISWEGRNHDFLD